MPHMIAGIDVHKRILAVVVADAEAGSLEFERRKFYARAGDLRLLSEAGIVSTLQTESLSS